jgi:hypothetical protein
MLTSESIVEELGVKGSERIRALYARHGMAPELSLGVLVGDLKPIAKAIKGRQELACQLYETGLCYVQPLLAQAKAAARKIPAASPNGCGAACKLPDAAGAIAKAEAAGKIGKKKKTIRC